MKTSTNEQPTASPRPSYKVALVEDRLDMRESWSQLINSLGDFRCVCVCASGTEALKLVATAAPDVVLMDIFMPRMSGIECTARLKALLPKIPIVILTMSNDNEMVFRALQAGADGYLLKRTKPTDLRAALLDVLSGGAPMSSDIARRVVESFRTKGHAISESANLTAREEEILLLLTKGFSNKEIADRLNVSSETVRVHLKHIYEKMHVRSRGEAVARYTSNKVGSP